MNTPFVASLFGLSQLSIFSRKRRGARRAASLLLSASLAGGLTAAAPCVAQAQAAPGVTFSTFYSFPYVLTKDFYPVGGLTANPSGGFYGATFGGGEDGAGSVYAISSSAAVATLYSFPESNQTYVDGQVPNGSLVLDASGNLYGTCAYGGANGDGTIFKVSPAGVFTLLYTFSGADGDAPQQGLVLGADGNFYGTTSSGGASNEGTVFEITPTGTQTTLYSFAGGTSGGRPIEGFILGADGNFYGTTNTGGDTAGDGTVFKITPSGVLTTLHTFNGGGDGQSPAGGLTQGSDGSLYGTTSYGGANANGTAYKITPSGTFTLLHTFSALNGSYANTDGATPVEPLTQGTDGNLYGTALEGGANNTGTVFQLTPSGTLTTLYSFSADSTGNADGAEPESQLLEAADGSLYGIAHLGGTDNVGAIFKLVVPSLTGGAITGSGARFDYNGDGHADLFWHNTASGALSIWDMNDQQVLHFGGTFATIDPASHWQPVASVDVNGDGFPDIIWWNSQTGELSTWLLRDDAVLQYNGDFNAVPDTTWKPVAAADVVDNTAGSPTSWELVFQNTSTGAISRWVMSGANATAYGGTIASLGANSPWQIVGAPDIDGDGHSDLLFWNSSTGEVSYWGMNLPSSQVLSVNPAFTQLADTDWHLVGSEDTNGDGHPDLVWWNASTGEVSRWLLNGATVTQYGNDTATVPNTTWQPTAIR